MRVAIDCMGGDNAPSALVKGALMGSIEYGVEVLLIGNEEQIASEVANCELTGASFEIIHASQIISNDEAPALAVRRKKDSSVVVAGRLVREGHADAMVTAGSTGAFLATGLLVVGRMQGIRRPALAPVIPGNNGLGPVLLDVGANMDATPQDLLSYAIMGAIYAQNMLGRANPSVALLNVGTEDGKGNKLAKEAFGLLSDSELHFVGNLEARDLPTTNVDVVVCDGFVGNVALKLMEGMAKSIFSTLKQEFRSSLKNTLGALLLKRSLLGLKQKLSADEVGGAPLLGLRGLCVKCHGSSNEHAVMNGIRQVKILGDAGVVDKMAEQASIVAQEGTQ